MEPLEVWTFRNRLLNRTVCNTEREAKPRQCKRKNLDQQTQPPKDAKAAKSLANLAGPSTSQRSSKEQVSDTIATCSEAEDEVKRVKVKNCVSTAKNYVCSFCKNPPKLFTKYTYDEHQWLVHRLGEPRPLPTCHACKPYTYYDTRAALGEHLSKKHNLVIRDCKLILTTCSICLPRIQLGTRVDLASHYEHVHEIEYTRQYREIVCKLCNPIVDFSCKQTFKSHMKSKHPKKFESFLSADKMLVDQPENSNSHATVNQTTTEPNPTPEYEKWLTKRKPAASYKFVCNFCKKLTRFTCKLTYDEHRWFVHKLGPPRPLLTCTLCNPQVHYESYGAIQKHMNNKHKNELKQNSVQKTTCSLCKPYVRHASKDLLSKHFKEVHEITLETQIAKEANLTKSLANQAGSSTSQTTNKKMKSTKEMSFPNKTNCSKSEDKLEKIQKRREDDRKNKSTKNKYICNECEKPKTFQRKPLLDEHQWLVHELGEPTSLPTCDVCRPYTYHKSKAALYLHFRLKHKIDIRSHKLITTTCSICYPRIQLPTDLDLVAHYNDVHKVKFTLPKRKKIFCTLCKPFLYLSCPKYFIEHMKSVHPKEFKSSPSADSVLADQSKTLNSNATVIKERTTSKSSPEYEKELTTKEPNPKNKVLCEICEIPRFNTKLMYDEHRWFVHRQGPPRPLLTCTLCKPQVHYERYNTIHSHVTRFHKKNIQEISILKTSCSMCDPIVTCATEEDLLKHFEEIHELTSNTQQENDVACPLCVLPRMFNNSKALKVHLVKSHKKDQCTADDIINDLKKHLSVRERASTTSSTSTDAGHKTKALTESFIIGSHVKIRIIVNDKRILIPDQNQITFSQNVCTTCNINLKCNEEFIKHTKVCNIEHIKCVRPSNTLSHNTPQVVYEPMSSTLFEPDPLCESKADPGQFLSSAINVSCEMDKERNHENIHVPNLTIPDHQIQPSVSPATLQVPPPKSTNDKVGACDVCERKPLGLTKQRYAEHLWLVHQVGEPAPLPTCDLCSPYKYFTSTNALNSHLRYMHNILKVGSHKVITTTCSICYPRIQLPTDLDLVAHYKDVHKVKYKLPKQKEILCTLCNPNKYISCPQYLRVHMRLYHKKELESFESANKIVSDKPITSNSQDMVTKDDTTPTTTPECYKWLFKKGPVSYRCFICKTPRNYKTKACFEEHRWFAHRLGPPRPLLTCTFCKPHIHYAFTRSFLYHVARFHKKNIQEISILKTSCSMCDPIVTCATEEDLLKHFEEIHELTSNTQQANEVACPLCVLPRMFNNTNAILVHLIMYHKKNKPNASAIVRDIKQRLNLHNQAKPASSTSTDLNDNESFIAGSHLKVRKIVNDNRRTILKKYKKCLYPYYCTKCKLSCACIKTYKRHLKLCGLKQKHNPKETHLEHARILKRRALYFNYTKRNAKQQSVGIQRTVYICKLCQPSLFFATHEALTKHYETHSTPCDIFRKIDNGKNKNLTSAQQYTNLDGESLQTITANSVKSISNNDATNKSSSSCVSSNDNLPSTDTNLVNQPIGLFTCPKCGDDFIRNEDVILHEETCFF